MNYLSLKLSISAVLVSFLFYSLASTSVGAQQVSVALGPPLARAAIQPGKIATITYTLENKGDPAIVGLKVRPFRAKNSSGGVIVDENFSGPIRFSSQGEGQDGLEETFFLKSNEEKKIKILIDVPAGTPQKDYYYALLGEVQAPPEVEGATSVRMKATTASYMLLTVTESGEIDNEAKILSFVVKPSGKGSPFGKNSTVYDSNTKIDLNLQIENTGKNVIYPRGTIELRGLLGGHASYNLPPQTILAGSQRKYSMTLPRFFLGRYKIAANLSLGEGAPLIFAQNSFIVFPFKIGGVILALGIGLFLLRRKKKLRRDLD